MDIVDHKPTPGVNWKHNLNPGHSNMYTGESLPISLKIRRQLLDHKVVKMKANYNNEDSLLSNSPGSVGNLSIDLGPKRLKVRRPERQF